MMLLRLPRNKLQSKFRGRNFIDTLVHSLRLQTVTSPKRLCITLLDLRIIDRNEP